MRKLNAQQSGNLFIGKSINRLRFFCWRFSRERWPWKRTLPRKAVPFSGSTVCTDIGWKVMGRVSQRSPVGSAPERGLGVRVASSGVVGEQRSQPLRSQGLVCETHPRCWFWISHAVSGRLFALFRNCVRCVVGNEYSFRFFLFRGRKQTSEY